MRVALWWITTLILIVSVSCQNACSLSQISVHQSSVTGTVKQTLVANDDNTEIYILTHSNLVYRSTDGGQTFASQMRFMTDSDVQQPLYDQSGIQAMTRASADGHVIFLGFGYQYWTTEGGSGNTYKYYKATDAPWVSITPSATSSDNLLGVQFSAGCLDESKSGCYRSAYVSKDFGENWTLLKDHVFKAEWGPSQSVFLTAEHGSDRYFYQMDLTGKVLLESGPGSIDFRTMNDVLYVAQQHADRSKTLLVGSTAGDSITLSDSSFPLYLEEFPGSLDAYHIIDNAQGVTFLHSIHGSDATSGLTLAAPLPGYGGANDFTFIMRGNKINPATNEADFQSIQGLDGVYIANAYEDLSVVAAGDRKLLTKLSGNKGATWTTVPLPSTSTCTSTSCHLHLRGLSDGHKVLSTAGTPGLVLALGNEGEMVETQNDKVNVYVSRNAGGSWERVLHGPNELASGNFGGLLLAVSSVQSTQYLSYSWTQGSNWESCSFSESTMEVERIVPLGDDGTTRFLLIGSDESSGTAQGKIILLDFTSSITKSCAGEESPGESGSDYELWTTGECVMGSKSNFVRRKQESACIMEAAPAQTQSEDYCECSREDYTCDGHCYVHNMETDMCVYSCEDGAKGGSLGYRKVVGDVCKGEDDNYYGEESPNPVGEGWLAWSILVVFTLLSAVTMVIVVLLVLYHKNDSVHNALAPHVPVWCVRDPSSEDTGSSLRYEGLDGGSSSLLDEDDLFS